ncbi:MAG: extracellular solute-binding protein [Rhodobacteraceae bacterium]|nr:extracellular solute-binding protein [Paracoccaceae bacterium]
MIGAAGLVRADGHENVTVTHGYNFFGELGYPDADFPHLNYVNPEAPKGGEISIWAQGTFDSFNPYTLLGNNAALSSIGDEDVLTSFADDPTSVYCLLCETMEYPEDLSWVIFNLRPEVTFSDGRPMTAEDIEFAFNSFMTDGLPSFRAAFGSFIDSVEVLGPHQIRYNFNADSPPRDRISTAGIIGPLHRDWYAENETTVAETRNEPHPGTGPYALESFDFSRQVVYKRNPDYWGNDLNLMQGRSNFDRIRIEYFGDSTAAFEGFKAGTYTFRTENTSRIWATQYNFPAIEDGFVVSEELDNGSLGRMQSFIFNMRREKFADERVREAIRLMFNFNWSNESLFFGLYDRPSSFWEFSDNAASGMPSEGELALLQPLVDEGLLPASILTEEAVVAPSSGARQFDRRNARMAQDLLDEAGWIVNESTGLREKDGETLVVGFLESSPSFDRIINPYVENLRAVGIDAKLERVDPAQEQERARSFDFDMTTMGWSLGYEPSTGLRQWFDGNLKDDTARNLAGVDNPAVNNLIETIVAAESKSEMETAVQALDRVLRSLKFNVPQWQNTKRWVAYWDQYDYPKPLPPLALGQLDFWWYDEDKAQALRDAGAL